MTIAVFHDLPSGGAKRALHELCRELARQGHTLDLFIPETADEAFLPLDAFIRTKVVFSVTGVRRASPGQPARWTPIAWMFAGRCHPTIAAVINRGNYDVAFVHGGRYPQVPSLLRHLTIPSVLYCQEPNRILYEAPIRDTEQSGGGASPSGLRDRLRRSERVRDLVLPIIHRKRMERVNITHATMVLANSYFSHESILRAFGVDATVRYLGVDADRFRPLGLSREPVVLAVGAVHPAKGLRFLIASVARIEARMRPKVIVIADREKPGEREVLARMAAEGGVNVTIRTVDDEELIRSYNRASVVAYVPYLEPFGFVPLEAMACGTPVVGVREGGVRETVVDGETGLLIDRDPQACAEAVVRLLTDAPLRERMGTEARRVVEDRWTWAQAGARVAESLRRVARER